MCGRFSLIADLRELGERFGFDPGGLTHPPSTTAALLDSGVIGGVCSGNAGLWLGGAVSTMTSRG